MKTNSSLVLLRIAALTSTVAVLGCSDPEVLAKVGDARLRKAELERVVGETPRGRGTDPSQVLDTLIDRELLAEAARDADLDRDPKIRAHLASSEREVLAQAFLERELAPHLTDAALRKRYEDLKDSLAQRQVHVRHVMVRLPEEASGDQRRAAQQRINLIYARLVGGEDLEALVVQLNADSAQQVESAELGVLREGQVLPVLFDTAAALKDKEYSKPFETPFGFHVLQALAPARTVTPTFEEVRSQMSVDARREAEAALVERLREDIRVRRYPERLAKPKSAVEGAPADASGAR